MIFQNVCIESLGYTVPDEVWTSESIEKRLEPLYSRLKLPAGRLELMTGIRERRFWEPNVRPSDNSVRSCEQALRVAEIPKSSVGCLIHGSVCRDYLEPATACSVHHRLGLDGNCLIYDISNACLGILNGVLQAANMIELGQVQSALVVGSEGGRQLVETTINALNEDTSLTRKSVKPAFASLTIGSASCAVLLTHKSISSTQNRLVAAAATSNTKFNDLCQSHQDQAGSEMAPLMFTDSETLMREGVATGVANMQKLLANAGWSLEEIDKSVCHQVGSAHQKLMLESLNVDPANDYGTFSWLGNTGSAALPISLACGCQEGFIETGDRLALFGIGSGINSIMMAIDWQESRIGSDTDIRQTLSAISASRANSV